MSRALSKRHKARIDTFLATGPKTTHEIYDHLNNATKNGIIMQQLGNILGNKSKYRKVGSTKVKSGHSWSYDVGIWELSE